MDKKENLKIDALFLGPKSENAKFFKETLLDFVNEHIYWRRDFHPEDESIISIHEQNERDFKETENKIQEVLRELSSKLKTPSIPWHSPR